MTPDSPCLNVDPETGKDCRHALKFHNPCSKCGCLAFATSAAVLGRPGGTVAALPTGSVTAAALESGHVTESGLIVPMGGES